MINDFFLGGGQKELIKCEFWNGLLFTDGAVRVASAPYHKKNIDHV